MGSRMKDLCCCLHRMEPEADQLILESLNINYIDESEYPSTTNIQNRCHPAVVASFVIWVLRHQEYIFQNSLVVLAQVLDMTSWSRCN